MPLYKVFVFGGLQVFADVFWRGEDSEIGDIYWINRHTGGPGNKFYNHLRDKVDDADVMEQAADDEPWDIDENNKQAAIDKFGNQVIY